MSGGLDELKRKVSDNRMAVFFVLLAVLTIGPFVYAKLTNRQFTSEEVGYTITGPKGWQMIPSQDKMTVTYKKHKGDRPRNTEITVSLELDNPYGLTPLDYISRGMVPQIIYRYQTVEGGEVQFRDRPFTTSRAGLDWAVVAFDIYHFNPETLEEKESLQVLYATVINDYSFLLALRTSENTTERAAAEKAFYRTLDSIRTRVVERKNAFIDGPLSGSGP